MANTYSLVLQAASQQYLSVANTTVLQPTGNFTIEGWVKTSTLTDQFIFFSGNVVTSVDSGIWLKINSSGIPQFFSFKNTGSVQGTDYQFVQGLTNIADGTWHHIAGVWDGANLNLYIDTILVATTAWTNAPAYNVISFVQIGALYQSATNANSSYFDGKIDDVRLWGIARSASNILVNWQRELAGNESNLNGYWKFDNNYLDTSPNGNNWTPSGIPSFSTDTPFADTTTTSTSTTTTSTSTSSTSTSTSSTSTSMTTTSTSTTTTSTSTSTSTSTTTTLTTVPGNFRFIVERPK
jgi:Concanavalin A-like lectin/glucanases superfamily